MTTARRAARERQVVINGVESLPLLASFNWNLTDKQLAENAAIHTEIKSLRRESREMRAANQKSLDLGQLPRIPTRWILDVWTRERELIKRLN